MKYLSKLKQKKGHPDELPKLPKGGAGIVDELPKLPKAPFDSKDSMPGRAFSEITPPAIEPMTTCLHGGKCKHLDGPGDRRPTCCKGGAPVFDLMACPLNKWAPGTDWINKNQKRKAEAMTEQDEYTPVIVTDTLEIHPIGEIMPWITDMLRQRQGQGCYKIWLAIDLSIIATSF